MRIQPEFPLCRVDDPMRRAEQTIYRILEESEAPGRALYEARILPHGRQIDFPVWIEGVARYAIEAKGAGTSSILRMASGASSLTRGGSPRLRPRPRRGMRRGASPRSSRNASTTGSISSRF